MTEAARPPRIMEVTLRDGSYTINFGFTAGDTRTLCRELDALGFPMIEIGHGVGLGASERNMGVAAETDEGYLAAAAESIRNAQWGAFCIPGIATLDHVDMAADHGMHFIRIGTSVQEVEESRPFIERARKRGMYVAANFMKSYATPPAEFAKKAKLSHAFGAELIYIVDSAGGMLPEELEGYVRAVRDVSDCPLGFHGHNNLGLAVANSLRAVELGVEVIDTSLQGLGRSAGNTPTEQFLLTLERKGLSTGIDCLRAMDIADQLIKPLVTRSGYDAIDMVSGYAQFHSSYMKIIREFSGKYQVDPRRLIIALCERDRENAPRDLVERLAEDLQKDGGGAFPARYRFDRYFGMEQLPPEKR